MLGTELIGELKSIQREEEHPKEKSQLEILLWIIPQILRQTYQIVKGLAISLEYLLSQSMQTTYP